MKSEPLIELTDLELRLLITILDNSLLARLEDYKNSKSEVSRQVLINSIINLNYLVVKLDSMRYKEASEEYRDFLRTVKLAEEYLKL